MGNLDPQKQEGPPLNLRNLVFRPEESYPLGRLTVYGRGPFAESFGKGLAVVSPASGRPLGLARPKRAGFRERGRVSYCGFIDAEYDVSEASEPGLEV